MSRRIKLAKPNPDDQVRIELGREGDIAQFRLKPITIDVEDELEVCQENILGALEPDFEAAEHEDNEEGEDDTTRRVRLAREQRIKLVAAKVSQLDVLLEPVDGRKRTPSEILLQEYERGAVTRDEIDKLILDIVEAGRPT